jgi:predicted phage terminase large subunit-like protein
MQIQSPQLLDRAICEQSLYDFTQRAWHVVEPGKFVGGWHIEAICAHLEAIARRQISRLIINIPPRHMKSIGVNIMFPAWVWGQTTSLDKTGSHTPFIPDTWLGPGTRFLSIAHGGNLALRDAKKTKALILSPWYQERWGEVYQLDPNEQAGGRYSNLSGGARYTGSFSSGMLGEGGDIVIVDDPHPAADMTDKSREDALTMWSETIKGRLNDTENGAFIVIMQRLHEKDLTGHILAKESGWDHLCLPAFYEPNHPHPVKSSIGFKDPRRDKTVNQLLWPNRYSVEKMKEREVEYGPFGSSGQLQQRPTAREGGLFHRSWWLYADEIPQDGEVLRRWDLAGTEERQGNDPDWTVGVKMRRTPDGLYWIENVIRFREEPHELERRLRQTAEMDGYACAQWIPQDPGAGGKITFNHYARILSPYTVRKAPEGELGSKFNRADPFAGQVKAGNVILKRADWNAEFIEEHAMFPKASHDDQVDGASGAFHCLHQGEGGVFKLIG